LKHTQFKYNKEAYTMQYKITIKNQSYNVSGKKREVQNLAGRIRDAVELNHHFKELTGVIGISERSSTMMSLFGTEDFKIIDTESYNKEIAELLAMIDGAKQADFQSIIIKAKTIHAKHIPIVDKRRTPEQEKERKAKYTADQEEQEKQANIKADKDNAEKERLLQEYPYLIIQDGNIKSRVLAAKNIRIELSKAFPGQKFSVTSESYSGGDSVDVHWTDGPTDDEVNKIINKYQYGTFDGMEDIYNYHTTVFNNTFGDTKYVLGQRSISDEKYHETGAKMGYPDFKYERFKGFSGVDFDTEKMICREVRKISFYVAPTKSTPTPDKSGPDNIDKPTMQLNEERNGVEIKFPGKPRQTIIETLKANGFRWSRFQGLWWAKQNEKTLQIAEGLTV